MPIYQCPACKAVNSLRSSESRAWERPLRLFGIRAFRCKACSRRFHRKWNLSPKILARSARATAAPRIENTSVPAPAIDRHPSLERVTAQSESKSVHTSNPPKGLSAAEKRPPWQYWKLNAIPYTVKSFAPLVLLHFLVGTLEFQALGKAAMWVNLLSLVTLVGALLVFIDLYRAKRSSASAVGATVTLVLGWAGLFFAIEFGYGFLMGPNGIGLNSDIALYREQSPWIWMTYLILPLSGFIGCSAYLFYRNRRQPKFLRQ